ncbi:hypothetical protein KIPB_012564, partial [Kipferlia bialata]|eukprot:g12564.t1
MGDEREDAAMGDEASMAAILGFEGFDGADDEVAQEFARMDQEYRESAAQAQRSGQGSEMWQTRYDRMRDDYKQLDRSKARQKEQYESAAAK